VDADATVDGEPGQQYGNRSVSRERIDGRAGQSGSSERTRVLIDEDAGTVATGRLDESEGHPLVACPPLIL